MSRRREMSKTDWCEFAAVAVIVLCAMVAAAIGLMMGTIILTELLP